ncbi:MAG: LemA family protein [Candidatus Omnitrophica bacterium]|nr:LemA family protein [Candidatus Omnitrophota bacterium]
MKGQNNLFVIIFVLIVIAMIGVFFIINYNGLVISEKVVEESQAQIATVLKRRLSLIPNLVQIVKGYAEHEKDTLIAVTQARTNAVNTLKSLGSDGGYTKKDILKLQVSQTQLDGAIKGIFALVENYPSLKASSNFMALQDQLEGTENRIAVARQRYNVAVRVFNSKVETFPGVFIAPMFGFSEKGFFETEAKSYEDIEIEF